MKCGEIMNQENNNDVYHDDNSFNNQGMDMSDNEPTTGETLGNMANSGMNFAKGINNIKNNPALGLKKPKEKGKESDKKDSNNKNSQNNQNDNDPAKGQKNKKDDSGQMPRTKKNDDSKKPNAKNDSNNKNKSGNNNIGNKNKQGGMFSRFNPMNKTSKSKTGGTKKAAEAGAPNLNQMAKKGLRTAWTAAPIQVKLIIIGIAIVPIIILAFIAFFSIFGATVAATTAAMCDVEGSSSSYNGEDYQGSADVKEFMCKMQAPGVGWILTSPYGQRWGRLHAGVDLDPGDTGEPVYAAQSGTVVRAGWEGGYGYSVVIKHGETSLYTRYGHNSKLLVKKGDKVGKGQQIAEMGNTGNSFGAHIHFEVRVGGEYGTAQNINQYFQNHESFKANCGSMWEGEFTGDSANKANDTSGEYVSSGTSSSSQCCDTSSSGTSSGNYCPNGITVVAGSNNSGHNKDPENYPVGTFSLDEYVQMVVQGENGGARDEALKAQAVAIRTYTVNRTNNCTKSIRNSTEDQVAYKNVSERVKKAVSEVNGVMMLYNGNVFSAEYSSFLGTCNSSTCTGQVKKSPSSETTTFTMPKSYLTINAGHGRGLSQNGSNYMASQGKKYDEILKFFYADGIEITGSTSTCSVGEDAFNGKIWVYYQYNYSQNYGCGSSTIATSGCGPTAMAMVVSSFLNEKHDPVELAKFALKNGHRKCGSGTTWAFFKDAAEEYGLKFIGQVAPSNSDEVLTALNSGNKLVVASMGAGHFTKGGHYIMLTGTDGQKVTVQDPASKDRSKSWNFKNIVNSEAKQYFIFSK